MTGGAARTWRVTVLVTIAAAVAACGSGSVPASRERRARSEPPPSRAPAFPLAVHEEPPPVVPRQGRGAAPRELVLQGGHVGWIHDAALSPDGRLVAQLSLDMPDLGQELTPAVPYATLTVLEARSGRVRASWRFRSPDIEGAGRVRFSRDGHRIMTEGRVARVWDLMDGSVDEVDEVAALEGWATPDPTGRIVAVLRQPNDGADLERVLSVIRLQDRRVLSTRSLALSEAASWSSADATSWHPFGDGRLALSTATGALLIDPSHAGRARNEDITPPTSLVFGPRGGGLFAGDDEGSVVLHPRTLAQLGGAPWGRIEAIDPGGERLVGLVGRGSGYRFERMGERALFDARTGERVATLASTYERAPTLDPDLAPEASTRRFAFDPRGLAVWACRYVSVAAPGAPEGVEVPPDATEEDWVEYVSCESWDARTGEPRRRFNRSLPSAIPQGRGPLSLLEVGPELVVTGGGELVVALMRRVVVFSPRGELLHHLEDLGIETMITRAVEAPDGSGIALASSGAFGSFSRDGASAVLCPGLVDGPNEVRFGRQGPRLFTQRFECSTRARHPIGPNAILGVSQDGETLVVGEGDFHDMGGVATIRSASGRRPLPGLEVWCDVDGCQPRARFVAGDRFVLADGKLFDVRTGRLVREMDGYGDVYAPDGDVVATDGRVEEIRSGRLVLELPPSTETDDARAPASSRFSTDGRRLVFPAVVDGRPGVGLADLTERRVVWQTPLEAEAGWMAFDGEGHVIVSTRADRGRTAALRRLDASDGHRLGSDVDVRADLRASEDGGRLAWCRDGLLHTMTASGSPADMGPCTGRVIHVGERYVVTADGSRAVVTRVADRRWLRLRLVIYPDRAAWTVAEDEHGAWTTEPDAFDLFLLRDEGAMGTAPLQRVSDGAPGHDVDLVRRFFGSPRPR